MHSLPTLAVHTTAAKRCTACELTVKCCILSSSIHQLTLLLLVVVVVVVIASDDDDDGRRFDVIDTYPEHHLLISSVA